MQGAALASYVQETVCDGGEPAAPRELLNADRVPTRTGKRWAAETVRGISGRVR